MNTEYENLFEKMTIRRQELIEQEPPTPITFDSVLEDIAYFVSLTCPTADDIECYWYDCNLLAMLQEGYELAWSNDTLYINGKARQLPLDQY